MAVPGDNKKTNPAPKDSEPFKRALSVCARALGEDAAIEVSFNSERPVMVDNSIRLPDPGKKITKRQIAITRGAADSLSLRHACHDQTIHNRLAPVGDNARAIYDAVEQARVESLGAVRMKGVASNLNEMLEDKYSKQAFATASDANDVPLEEALSMMVREKLTGTPPPQSARNMVDLWRDWVEDNAGEKLGALTDSLEDQMAFANAVRDMLSSLGMANELGETDPQDSQDDDEDIDGNDDQAEDNVERDNEEMDGSDDAESETTEQPDEEGEEGESEASEAGADDMFDEMDDDDAETPGEAHRPEMPFTDSQHNSDYKVFTTDFDEEVSAEDLCDEVELERLRGFLDQQLANLQGVVGRLANRLQRKLMAQQNRGWDFDLEEGYLDTARLTRVVTDPTNPLSFKMERETVFRDTVVTLLLDNSGSMRGRPITIAAICADILIRTLERCGVKVEVLGFTTRAWKGGQSREKWLHAEKPALPGRLNDLRHIVYKSADAPWRRSRNNLGLMMREGLLKENIDGEALLWAHQRLMGRSENRRILMMISDGAPVDDSTLSVNPGNFLERHLRDVIEEIESHSPVELLAIGIGHDVTRYYSSAVTIVDADELAGAMTEQLANLFVEETKRPHVKRKRGQY